jgi:hypothetical protein
MANGPSFGFFAASGGWISFADYMGAALYAPGLGYYVAGARKFGPSGDFVTAPEMTPLFGRALATQVAGTIAELLNGLEHCSDASIFHHTFQTLGSHHFLTEGFSNDFAQWALAAANRGDLAEQLAAIDVRDYLSLAELRSDLRHIVATYCAEHPQIANQTALERFYFCEAVEVTVPLGLAAQSLEEFRQGFEHLSHASFYFHFISSRLRLHLRTNDFSLWLANSLGLEALAASVNRIDIYTNTLDTARAKLLRLLDHERKKA